MARRDERRLRRSAARGDVGAAERLAGAGGGRWALAFERDRDEEPPVRGGEAAVLTLDPGGITREMSHDVWVVPVATVEGLAALNDELVGEHPRSALRVPKARQAWIVDRAKSKAFLPGRAWVAAEEHDGSRVLWSGWFDQRSDRLICVFCRGERRGAGGAVDREWAARYRTTREPRPTMGATTCAVCRRRIEVGESDAAANELALMVGDVFWDDDRVTSGQLVSLGGGVRGTRVGLSGGRHVLFTPDAGSGFVAGLYRDGSATPLEEVGSLVGFEEMLEVVSRFAARR